MKSLYCRYHVQMAATSTAGGNIRIIIFYDKQSNTQAPGVTDLLLADAFTSPNNLSNRDRFTVLADEVTESIGAATGAYTHSGVLYKRLNHEVMFNAGAAGTIGDITSGAMYIMFAQNGSIATAAPLITWRCRIRYTDN